MNKKGIVVEVGAFVLLILVTAGILLTLQYSNALYVGNKLTGEYVDYFKCKAEAEKINDENLQIFSSKKEAELSNYNAKTGCV